MKSLILLQNLNDQCTNSTLEVPKRKIEARGDIELSPIEVTTILPKIDIHVANDRKFRRQIRNYLKLLLTAKKRQVILPFKEAIVFHDNEWKCKNTKTK